ncbi:MAG TPA: PHP domain-containing protein [Dehalococcoidales bacterium]|nr:PHP domain-containing protein [Dehalococcoidales bacterium]
MLKADLHIHTKYSMDCETPLEKIIERCQELGITCIAIADHGTAQGGLEMQKIAPFKVIVAEEILTTHGEIMGMFLKETIPSGCTPQEAVKAIRAQGGLVNIPHPFETIRGSALKDAMIDEIAADIDIMEVLNSRSPFPANTNRAKAFAAAHKLPGGAGSDAHTVIEIGNAYIEIPDFNTKEEFLKAVAQGKIKGRRSGPIVNFVSFCARVKAKITRRANNGKAL